jgi:hypothetical protein
VDESKDEGEADALDGGSAIDFGDVDDEGAVPINWK